MKRVVNLLSVLLLLVLSPYANSSNINEYNLLDLFIDQGKEKPNKNQPVKSPQKGPEKQQPTKNQTDKKQSPQKEKGSPKQQPVKSPQDNKQNPQKGQDKKPDFKPNKKGSDKSDKNGMPGAKNGKGGKDFSPGAKGGKTQFKSKGKDLDFKHPYKYGKPGKWMAYGNNGFYYGKNYGQYRSMIARNQHKQFIPLYEYQAVGVFNIILDRNVYLITQTDHKIVYLRSTLLQRRRAGLITVVMYDNYIDRIVLLERRRSGVELSLNMYL